MIKRFLARLLHIENSFQKHTQIIDSSQTAALFFRKIWNKELLDFQEEVYVIFIDDDSQTLGHARLHAGGTNKCYIDLAVLFKFAYKYKASGIFIAHNHPKGSLKPSKYDIDVTYKIRKMCNELGFHFMDHIIITPKSYFSFSQSGLLD